MSELARVIVDFEQSEQMTLMHRFNKACDLLDQVQQARRSPPPPPSCALHPGVRTHTLDQQHSGIELYQAGLSALNTGKCVTPNRMSWHCVRVA